MRVIIVGGGIAGVTAADMLSKEKGIRIDIFTDEPYLFYSRPRLWEILSGESGIDRIIIYDSKWYEDRGIRVYLNSKVGSIDTNNRQIYLTGGKFESYDILLLTCGSSPSVPPIVGVDKKGVFTIRTINDVLSVKQYSHDMKKAAVIGGGLLGLEAAKSLLNMGLDVTVIEFFQRLLPRQLDDAGANLLKRKLESMGLRFILDAKTDSIEGDENASGVKIKDKGILNADIAIISAGIKPNLSLVRDSGINVNKGVIVDSFMKTNIEGVFAAGDVAEHDGKIYGIIPAAIEQAKAAAMNIIREDSFTYTGTIPSNTLKVAGIDMTSTGIVNPEGEGFDVISEVHEDTGVYKKVVIKDGKAVGSIILGDRKNALEVTRLIKENADASQVKEVLFKAE